jgi:hypothetical protein
VMLAAMLMRISESWGIVGHLLLFAHLR